MPSSLGSMGSPGMHHTQVFAAYDQVTPTPAVVDTTSGAIIPLDVASAYLTSSQVDGSGHYQTFLHIINTRAYIPQSPLGMAPSPRPEYPKEQRTIIIRELGLGVTEQGLQDLLVAQNVAHPSAYDIPRPERNKRCYALIKFSTASDAREAVPRLHNQRFMERRLQVKLAQERSTIGRQRGPIIADGSV